MNTRHCVWYSSYHRLQRGSIDNIRYSWCRLNNFQLFPIAVYRNWQAVLFRRLEHFQSIISRIPTIVNRLTPNWKPSYGDPSYIQQHSSSVHDQCRLLQITTADHQTSELWITTRDCWSLSRSVAKSIRAWHRTALDDDAAGYSAVGSAARCDSLGDFIVVDNLNVSCRRVSFSANMSIHSYLVCERSRPQIDSDRLLPVPLIDSAC